MDFPNSGPSSTYSGSPAQSDLSLPVIAPRPVPAGSTFDMWHEMTSCQATEGKVSPGYVRGQAAPLTTQHFGVPSVAGVDVQGFEMLFDGTFTGMDEF